MALSPQLYDRLVRPKWITKRYIHDHLTGRFDFSQRVILDFGCGTGANSPMFSPDHYLGIDPDDRRIQLARWLYPGHSFDVWAGGKLPREDETVDFVVVIAVLHHIPSEEIASCLNEFRRILKPSGTIIVMEPCSCDSTPLCNWFMNLLDDGDYIRDQADYLKLFAESNFAYTVLKTFRKCLLYRELLFTAKIR